MAFRADYSKQEDNIFDSMSGERIGFSEFSGSTVADADADLDLASFPGAVADLGCGSFSSARIERKRSPPPLE